MCQFAREIVSAELVLRHLPVLDRVEGPFGKFHPVIRGIPGTRAVEDDRRGEEQHVAALLQRHMVAVMLAVGIGIDPHVVRRPGPGPLKPFRVIEYEIYERTRNIVII